jgi:ADP-ribose pyrophosphatase YjhB (NUDIX family)
MRSIAIPTRPPAPAATRTDNDRALSPIIDASPVAGLRMRLRCQVWALLPSWGQRFAVRLCAPKVSLGVCAVIRDPRGRVLVAYHPYRRAWGLPGGFVAHDEQPDAALRREIGEELDVAASVGPLLGAHAAPDVRHLTLYYAVTIAETPRVDGVEIDALRYVPEDELPALMDSMALVWLHIAPMRAA